MATQRATCVWHHTLAPCQIWQDILLSNQNIGLLQELLQYTMHQHLPDSAESLEDWATLESDLPQGGPLPSVENGSPLVSPR